MHRDDEESAFPLAFCEKQIPRFSRNDTKSDFFISLLNMGSGLAPRRGPLC